MALSDEQLARYEQLLEEQLEASESEPQTILTTDTVLRVVQELRREKGRVRRTIDAMHSRPPDELAPVPVALALNPKDCLLVQQWTESAMLRPRLPMVDRVEWTITREFGQLELYVSPSLPAGTSFMLYSGRHAARVVNMGGDSE